MKPLISIIVPVLNSAKYLNECFNSIQVQSYRNFEVIVVLGESEDKSKEFC